MQCFQSEWNIAIPLQLKKENQPSSRDDLGHMDLIRVVAVVSGIL